MVVSTRQTGPNVRLAPRTGRLDVFWANLGLCGPKRPKTEKRPYLGLRAPNREIRGHFSGVPPLGFGGFHTSDGPQRAPSTPYQPLGCVLGQFGPTAGPPKRPKTGKRSYLGLGAPNCESEGTCLRSHPTGLGVSTRQTGPNARLAACTGCQAVFWANLGPQQQGQRTGPKRRGDMGGGVGGAD